ncbi:Tyrosine aminotransferase [Melipona quadrifasciata]|uniref:Tyrosine aminotransferase n=1 Tax=Melipona quadrifasciata TaxID=166423 RepID=A0A0N0BH97_9HYME|nr:Tyrosine aminotransferase [Melipona quadrifasciata]
MSVPVRRDRWNVQASDIARNTHNPIRSIVESLVVEPNPTKSVISLSIGDPTTFGNLRPPKEVIDAVQQSLVSQLYNGYAPSTGTINVHKNFPLSGNVEPDLVCHQKAREAVAEYSSSEFAKVDAKDVILCSGCSCALDLCITALARRGQNILIPRPGFSIYRTLAEGLGINVKSYELRVSTNYPAMFFFYSCFFSTGDKYPFHSYKLSDILDVAARYYIPIIADEIYEHMVFPGRTFHSLASLSREVPILSFLVPGWRMGWIIIHDRQNVLEKEIRKALHCLSQRIIGSNTLIQGALPAILKNTPQEFYDDVMKTLHDHSRAAYNCVMKIPGLKPIVPDGAMYMMVRTSDSNETHSPRNESRKLAKFRKVETTDPPSEHLPCFPEFNSDLEFVQRLLMEESVFCLPGQCFDYPSYMRLVITVPVDMLEEACQRIQEFCERHHYKTAENTQRNNLATVDIPY